MNNEELRAKVAEILAMETSSTIEEAVKRLGLMDKLVRGEGDADKRVCKIS
jgi:hypothetical protein